VNGINGFKSDESFHLIDCTIGFKRAHRVYFAAAHKPIQRGHWRAIFQEGSIQENNGLAVCSAHNNSKFALGNTTNEASDCLDVVR
jgi:hypothetical protein